MSVRTFNHHTGVGLIEVLVAVLIFSMGALGLAAMQLAAKRNTFEATQRSIAVGLAADILERMRVNPGVAAAYAVAELGAGSPGLHSPCDRSMCTPTQLAASDLYQWGLLLEGHSELAGKPGAQFASGGLVDPRACITVKEGVVTVALAWRGMNALENPIESSCGESEDLYGPDNNLRRLLSLTTYIAPA